MIPELNDTTNAASIGCNVSSSLAIVAPEAVEIIDEPMAQTKLFNLPDDILKHEIGEYLDPVDKEQFSKTSKLLCGLFHKSAPLFPKVLLCIAHGEQDKVQPTLKALPSLLECYGEVTDYSGRKFTNISIFQFALWAKDTHMQRMILDAIPEDDQGLLLRTKLIRQYEELVTNGVAYELAGQTYTESHFNFSPLINALQHYIDNVDAWQSTGNIAAIIEAWSKGVGGAQRDVPAHVAQEYCHPTRSFSSTPFFPSAPLFNELRLERSLTFYNSRASRNMTWWDNSSYSLGRGYGIYRGGMMVASGETWLGYFPRRGRMGWWGGGARGPQDLLAVKALEQVRTTDLIQTLKILKQEQDPEPVSSCVIS